MPAVKADPQLVARCGLYCGACRAYRAGRCRGCAENAKASWCKVRSCCSDHGHATCADCAQFADARACRKFNGWIPQLIGLVLRSDRPACIDRIRAVGCDAFAAEMAARGQQTIRR